MHQEPAATPSHDADAPEVRIVLIDEQRLYREAAAAVFDDHEGFRVVGHTGTADEGVRLASDLQPDVVILDAGLDEAMLVVSQLAHALGTGHVLVLTEDARGNVVKTLLNSGAAGVGLKSASVQALATGIRQLAAVGEYLHPEAASSLAQSYTAMIRGDAAVPDLTARQREIVTLVSKGLQNKQIARRLDIGMDTVKTHISRIMRKLEAESRTEAVVKAMNRGLIVA